MTLRATPDPTDDAEGGIYREGTGAEPGPSWSVHGRQRYDGVLKDLAPVQRAVPGRRQPAEVRAR